MGIGITGLQSSPFFGRTQSQNNRDNTVAIPVPDFKQSPSSTQPIDPAKQEAQELSRQKSESYNHIMSHEQAHQSAAGGLGGGIVIEYDSKGRAVAGHVPISMPGLDPQNPDDTISKLNRVRSAALAPGDPSGQDMSVAASAMSMIGRAQVASQNKRKRESSGDKENAAPTGVPGHRPVKKRKIDINA